MTSRSRSFATAAGVALVALAAAAPVHAQGARVAKDQGGPSAPSRDIVETAMAAGSFNTLARALTVAGLVETLKGPGPFTVFAPTDAAFAKIPKATLDALLADREQLTKVLTYHVVAGRVPASQVVRMSSAKTVNGATVAVMAHDGKVMLNDATVTKADIMTSNGIIHVIDTVLLPK